MKWWQNWASWTHNDWASASLSHNHPCFQSIGWQILQLWNHAIIESPALCTEIASDGSSSCFNTYDMTIRPGTGNLSIQCAIPEARWYHLQSVQLLLRCLLLLHQLRSCRRKFFLDAEPRRIWYPSFEGWPCSYTSSLQFPRSTDKIFIHKQLY